MTNPYKAPESNLKNPPKRIYKTPIIVPLSILIVVCIYAGYSYVYYAGVDQSRFAFFKNISFGVFVGTQIGMNLLAIVTMRQIDAFLKEHPSISSRSSLESLKPIARTNMYAALLYFFFLALGSLAAIVAILKFGGIISISVAVLAVATVILAKWASRAEERLKQIECSNPEVEKELNEILHCWQNKPFPNF